jgi:hypothetical protein
LYLVKCSPDIGLSRTRIGGVDCEDKYGWLAMLYFGLSKRKNKIKIKLNIAC